MCKNAQTYNIEGSIVRYSVKLNLVVKQFNFLCPVFESNSILFRSDSTPPHNFVSYRATKVTVMET